MKTIVFIFALFVSVPMMAQTTKTSTGATLEVTIKNVTSSDGNVHINLHNKEEDFLKKDYKEIVVKPVNGQDIVVKFTDLPAGEYSVSVIHDVNSNKGLDANFMGMPTEPYGISMTGKNKYGPPSYDNAKFQIKNENQSIIISL